MNKVDLNLFSSKSFNKGKNNFIIILWYFVNALIVKASWNPFMGLKIILLKSFGAKVGNGLVIKNNVIIKYPWKLAIGENCWLGENCWIDNLDYVTIGNNVCISQGAMLLTGNHDYTQLSFDYRNASILIEDGVWIGAKAIVCPGVICKSHSILYAGSVASRNLDSFSIYQGIPAVKIRERKLK